MILRCASAGLVIDAVRNIAALSKLALMNCLVVMVIIFSGFADCFNVRIDRVVSERFNQIKNAA
jgi:hypothetical protein